jgi:hypothetical protein
LVLLPRVPFGKVEVITSKILPSLPWLGWSLWNICVTNDHRYVPLVVSTSRSFPHSRLITGFVTRITRRVPLVEQELHTRPEHLSSPPVFSGVRVTRSLVLYVCFVVVVVVWEFYVRLTYWGFFCRSLFVLLYFFLLAIVLSVLLRYTDSDCPFGIFKLFLFSLNYIVLYDKISITFTILLWSLENGIVLSVMYVNGWSLEDGIVLSVMYVNGCGYRYCRQHLFKFVF